MRSSGSSSPKQLPRLRAEPAGCWFDEAAAGRVCDFFELCLTHCKGDLAGKPFTLERWQRQILRAAFGWKRKDGSRRYRTVYVRIPRKNGKSTLAAGVALYLLTADAENGADIYGAANSREQARIIFDVAANMVKASDELRDMCQVFRNAIVLPIALAAYTTIAAEASTADGLNPHGIVVDELHEMKKRDFWAKLTSAGAARRQPMTFITTTAGVGRHTIEYELHDHAKRVLAGTARDDAFLPVLYEADPEDDWHNVAVWKKANPNWGISVSPAYLRDKHRLALMLPGEESNFKRYHLNLDVEASTSWVRMDCWDACPKGPTWEEVRGRPAWVGLDLSKRTDLTAMVAVTKEGEGWTVHCKFFLPVEGIRDRERIDKVPYGEWIRRGWLTATPGNIIDYAFIRAALHEWARHLDVREVAYDPMGSVQLAVQLGDDGLECVEHRQDYKSMSEPTKLLEEHILTRRLRHGGNPVLRWMVSNVSVTSGPTGLIKPDKVRSTARIDGVVALVMAIGRATFGSGGGSVYDTEGLKVV